jgi:saccharopine dehydrogenase-like NADP-dependent oxidoreductase
MKPLKVVVLFSKGGLGDVGRHAVRAALDRTDPKIDQITVLSQHIETLNEENWKCGCTTPHKFTEDEMKRLTIVQIDSWDEKVLSKHFEGASAVISCLGNR